MNSQETSKPAARLRLRVSGPAESAIRAGHPWLFADSVVEQNRPGLLGELGVIYDRKNCFLGFGLFDPGSPLRLRMLHVGRPQVVRRDWWQAKLGQALERRSTLFDHQTTGYRCIHGENDGWSGLVLDRYGSTYVLKLYTAAWLPRLDEIVSLIGEAVHPQQLVLRLSRNIQALSASQFGATDGKVILGSGDSQLPVFLESGIRFQADVYRGQKTGFFLDQRENRREVERLAHGRRVLNLFSYSGGFSLYAARGGARSVTDLDISAHALKSADHNYALNHEIPTIAQCEHRTIQADTFEWLEQAPKGRFDLLVLDPPSFAKNKGDVAGALGAYQKLASSAIGVLGRNGLLLAASCSAHVSAEAFTDLMLQVARSSGRPFAAIKTTGHPPDHPANFPEAWYLKCLYLRFD